MSEYNICKFREKKINVRKSVARWTVVKNYDFKPRNLNE